MAAKIPTGAENSKATKISIKVETIIGKIPPPGETTLIINVSLAFKALMMSSASVSALIFKFAPSPLICSSWYPTLTGKASSALFFAVFTGD